MDRRDPRAEAEEASWQRFWESLMRPFQCFSAPSDTPEGGQSYARLEARAPRQRAKPPPMGGEARGEYKVTEDIDEDAEEEEEEEEVTPPQARRVKPARRIPHQLGTVPKPKPTDSRQRLADQMGQGMYGGNVMAYSGGVGMGGMGGMGMGMGMGRF